VEGVGEGGGGGVVVGEDAAGFGAPAGGGVEHDGFFDGGQRGEDFADAEVQVGVLGLSAHEVGHGQGEDAVEDVDPDLGFAPVDHVGARVLQNGASLPDWRAQIGRGWCSLLSSADCEHGRRRLAALEHPLDHQAGV